MKREHRDTTTLPEVLSFAEYVFEGMVRKGPVQKPMMDHFLEVAELVRDSGGSVVEEAAGILHDIFEVTETSITDVMVVAGEEVLAIIEELSDPPEFKALSSLEKKVQQAKRIRSASSGAKRVRLADLTSNLREIALNPPIGWSEEKCRQYIEGALRVAQECRGASPMLDNLFIEAYKKASAV